MFISLSNTVKKFGKEFGKRGWKGTNGGRVNLIGRAGGVVGALVFFFFLRSNAAL